jgi:hypothetical protein
VRFLLTPLTTFMLTSEAERTRFDFSPLRDSDGLRVTAGFEFQPDALLGGRASVGYRRFKSLAPDVPEYQGIAAAVSLAYVFGGRTRLEGRFDRDVAYSVEEITPYYLSTGGTFTATQQVVGPVDVTGTIGRNWLDYRSRSAPSRDDRRDVVNLYGGGVGVRVGDTVRIGMNVEFSERASTAGLGRTYDRRRVFASVTYGL